MLDFDEIDEVAASRLADGDLDEAATAAMGVPEAPPPFKGGYLLGIPRSVHVPDYFHLSRDMQARFKKPREKMPQIRLFVFYGAGDSYPAWMSFVDQAPIWADVAVHEWPSHGTRKSEVLPGDVDGLAADAMEGLTKAFKQHAKGTMAGAPFAFVGHSIGALVMIRIAHIIRHMFGLEPAVMFVLDRAAPHHSLCSEYGEQLLNNEPEHFIHIFNPVSKSFPADEEGRRMLQMWMNDIKLQHEGVKPLGYHTLNCPVHVCVALANWACDSLQAQANMKPQDLEWHKAHAAILGSQPDSGALWDHAAYEEWSAWTSKECHIHDMGVDHNMLKAYGGFHDLLWKTLDRLKASV